MAETGTPTRTFGLSPPLVTVRQAAQLLGLTPQRVNQLIADGKLRVNQELGLKVLDRTEVELLRQGSRGDDDQEPGRFLTHPSPVPAVDLEAEILGQEASAGYGPEHICPGIYSRIHQRLQQAEEPKLSDVATS